MLITLSRRAVICHSVSEVLLTKGAVGPKRQIYFNINNNYLTAKDVLNEQRFSTRNSYNPNESMNINFIRHLFTFPKTENDSIDARTLVHYTREVATLPLLHSDGLQDVNLSLCKGSKFPHSLQLSMTPICYHFLSDCSK